MQDKELKVLHKLERMVGPAGLRIAPIFRSLAVSNRAKSLTVFLSDSLSMSNLKSPSPATDGGLS